MKKTVVKTVVAILLLSVFGFGVIPFIHWAKNIGNVGWDKVAQAIEGPPLTEEAKKIAVQISISEPDDIVIFRKGSVDSERSFISIVTGNVGQGKELYLNGSSPTRTLTLVGVRASGIAEKVERVVKANDEDPEYRDLALRFVHQVGGRQKQ